jgi:aryl-alcohol dehydrogenase-like predicted oxidoreductase
MFVFLEFQTKAWCLKNDAINCVLLGASSVEQLIENIQSLHVIINGFLVDFKCNFFF